MRIKIYPRYHSRCLPSFPPSLHGDGPAIDFFPPLHVRKFGVYDYVVQCSVGSGSFGRKGNPSHGESCGAGRRTHCNLATIICHPGCSSLSRRRDDNQQIRERLFDDLLEVSRPALYPEAFRLQAMEIIVTQIACGDTQHLQCSFAKLDIDHDKLVAILSEIIAVVLFSKRGFANVRLVKAYMTALPQECHPWLPCVRFMTKLAQVTDGMLRGVSAARFLEMILWVSGSQTLSRDPNHLLADACSEAFIILSQPHSQDPYILRVAHIGGIHSDDSNSPIALPEVLTSLTANHMWLMVEARLLEIHAEAMLKLMAPQREKFRVHHRASFRLIRTTWSVTGNCLPSFTHRQHYPHTSCATFYDVSESAATCMKKRRIIFRI
ncbi:hypothetical protein C8R45DRAFT_549263 [Mycena sanguinolenta]|nr:hypothetical protein C8R45DRAFT_549263 [Mycena sanguinolenta]